MAETDSGGPLMALVGANVRKIREAKKLTQIDVAARLRMTTPNYWRVESGRQNLTLSTIARIADALGVKPSDLFREPRRAKK